MSPPPAQWKCPPSARARALARYQDSDESLPEIATAYGVTDRTVQRWVRAAGIPRRFRWLSREEDQQIADLYRYGFTSRAIGLLYKASQHAVLISLQRTNTPARPPGRQPQPSRPLRSLQGERHDRGHAVCGARPGNREGGAYGGACAA